MDKVQKQSSSDILPRLLHVIKRTWNWGWHEKQKGWFSKTNGTTSDQPQSISHERKRAICGEIIIVSIFYTNTNIKEWCKAYVIIHVVNSILYWWFLTNSDIRWAVRFKELVEVLPHLWNPVKDTVQIIVAYTFLNFRFQQASSQEPTKETFYGLHVVRT